MIWSDYGYLLSKNKFGENSLIAEFFTQNHGKRWCRSSGDHQSPQRI